MKQLVVNADDFGFTRDVNDGIVEAHTSGILTATTLMANGAAFEHAADLAAGHPELDVGCHLVLVQGRSLAKPGSELPGSVPELLRRLATGKIDPYAELRAQIERILAAGLRPVHLDTHKHTHLWPQVLDAVARLSQEFRIPWVRRPFDLPLNASGVPMSKRLISRSLRAVRVQFHRKLNEYGCRTTDHFAGFQITGRFRTAELVRLIEQLPPGLTEFMTHPGRCGPELLAASTRLKQSRQDELDALTAPEVRSALSAAGVTLVRYSQL